MNDIVYFLMNNWLLVLLLLMVVFLIFMEESQLNEVSSGGIAPEELSHALNKGCEVIDIRDRADFIAGHIQNAKHKDINRVVKLDFSNENYNKWVICCKDGVKSSEHIKSIRENNKTSIRYLVGGVDSWVASGFVLKKGE